VKERRHEALENHEERRHAQITFTQKYMRRRNGTDARFIYISNCREKEAT
jgi:hypothetical protein